MFTQVTHKAGKDLYIAAWLSQNNQTENSDQIISDKNANVQAIGTSVNFTNMYINRRYNDSNLTVCRPPKLKSYIIQDWPHR